MTVSHSRFLCSSDSWSKGLRLSPWPYFGSKAPRVASFTDVLWSAVVGCVTLMDMCVLAEASSAQGLR